MDPGRIVLGLLELLFGIGLFAAGRRMSRQAHERGGPMLAARLGLHVFGVVLVLYGLLQLLFALV